MKRLLPCVFVLLVLLVGGCVQTGQMFGRSPEDADTLERATVERVIDGDTVELKSGETVRLLGINAPERNEYLYSEAKETLRDFIEGKEVFLGRDEEEMDRYGRLLRYVFLGSENMNVFMVREGLATIYVIPPNGKYESELEEAWRECVEEGRNLCRQAGGICGPSCLTLSEFNWNAEGDDCDNPNDEYFILRNSCPVGCDLTEWTVKDEGTSIYAFPFFTLEKDSEVTVHSGCGRDTQEDLYWCNRKSCPAVWNNDGDTIFLRNMEGKLVFEYSYEGF